MAEVQNEDLWFMLLSTIRYSLGRTSYAPSYAMELTLRYRNELEPEQVKQLCDEVRDWLRRNARIRRGREHEYGYDNSDAWRQFVTIMKQASATRPTMGSRGGKGRTDREGASTIKSSA